MRNLFLTFLIVILSISFLGNQPQAENEDTVEVNTDSLAVENLAYINHLLTIQKMSVNHQANEEFWEVMASQRFQDNDENFQKLIKQSNRYTFDFSRTRVTANKTYQFKNSSTFLVLNFELDKNQNVWRVTSVQERKLSARRAKEDPISSLLETVHPANDITTNFPAILNAVNEYENQKIIPVKGGSISVQNVLMKNSEAAVQDIQTIVFRDYSDFQEARGSAEENWYVDAFEPSYSEDEGLDAYYLKIINTEKDTSDWLAGGIASVSVMEKMKKEEEETEEAPKETTTPEKEAPKQLAASTSLANAAKEKPESYDKPAATARQTAPTPPTNPDFALKGGTSTIESRKGVFELKRFEHVDHPKEKYYRIVMGFKHKQQPALEATVSGNALTVKTKQSGTRFSSSVLGQLKNGSKSHISSVKLNTKETLLFNFGSALKGKNVKVKPFWLTYNDTFVVDLYY